MLFTSLMGKNVLHLREILPEQNVHNIFKSILQLVSKAIHGIFFTIRITIATTLHYSLCVSLEKHTSILNSMNVFLFFFLGLCCIINYFHLDRHFISPTNYVTPVFVGFWILSCSARHLVNLIHEHLPFHRICRV